jgi:hypothetical protein
MAATAEHDRHYPNLGDGVGEIALTKLLLMSTFSYRTYAVEQKISGMKHQKI